jgi:hypothetical protein
MFLVCAIGAASAAIILSCAEDLRNLISGLLK